MWIAALWLLVVASAGNVEVPLCCPDGQVAEGIDSADGQEFIYCSDTVDPSLGEYKPMGNLSRRHHPLKCPSIVYFYDSYKLENITFEKHVDMLLSQSHDDKLCFDFDNGSVLLYSCADVPITQPTAEAKWSFTLASGLSVVFLLISATIYSLVKPLRSNAHSPYIVSHNLSLIMNYVSRITLQFITISEEVHECVYMAFVQQFCSMAAFFWMSALCLDIHITIRRMLPCRPEKSPFDKKFLLISLYAWGVPLIFTTVAVLFQFSDVLPNGSPFHPRVARWKVSCFFTGYSRWYLYKYPIAGSVVLSVALFIATAVVLYQHGRTMAGVREDSRFTNDKNCYILYLKLFVIMGIGWGLSWAGDTIIKFILAVTDSTAPPFFSYIYLVMDLVFCFQGFFIFILFVCMKRTLRILWEEIPFLRSLELLSWATGAKKSEDSSAGGVAGIKNAESKETIL